MAIEAMDAASPIDADASASTTKSAAKAFANKYRGVMMRPMTTAVTKAQADFKPFVVNQEDIDHNLYGKFLGILKDAGVPWKARRLPESREDAMHIMNAMVAAINAYQHYQKDVERAYHEIESSMASNKTHSHNQAADVSKLHNEVTMLRKKLAGTENNLAKTNNDLKGQISNLKSKLAQTERELNDSQIHARKLEKSLQLEKKQADHLMSKIMTADKPKFGKAARASSASARSPGQNAAAEPSNEASENSVSKSSPSPSLIPKNGAATPRKPNTVRSPLPWLDNDEEGLDRPQRHEYRTPSPAAASGANTTPAVGTPEPAVPRTSVPLSPASPPNGMVNGAKAGGGVVHKVQVTAGSPASTASGSLSDEEAGEEGAGGDGAPKSKSRFKKFLKAFKMSTKTKDGKDAAPTTTVTNSKAQSAALPRAQSGTTLNS